jgi:hypothetical protein
MTSTCTIQAEFRPDGTYTWNEQHRGEGDSTGISASFRVPEEGGQPARWQVMRARGNQLTVQLHSGEVVFDFQGENAFTMKWPQSTKTTGTVTFRRSRKPAE